MATRRRAKSVKDIESQYKRIAALNREGGYNHDSLVRKAGKIADRYESNIRRSSQYEKAYNEGESDYYRNPNHAEFAHELGAHVAGADKADNTKVSYAARAYSNG